MNLNQRQFGFHVASADVRESITKTGLQPSTPDAEDQPHGVYFFDNDKDAEKVGYWDDDKPHDVWHADVHDLPQQPDEAWPDEGFSVPQVVPPSRLRLHRSFGGA